MLRTFSVERFRGLDRCDIQGMRRICLITGRNNAGKTALLEAMFIHSGRSNPHLVMVVNAVRGIGKVEVDLAHTSDAPWRSIFSEFDDSKPVRFSAEVKIKAEQYDLVTVALSTVRSGPELSGLGIQLRAYNLLDKGSGPTKVLKLEHTPGRRAKTSKHFLVMDSKRQTVIPPPPIPDYQARLMSGQRESAEEIAKQFAKFQMEGKVPMLVEALVPMEPRLVGIELMFVGEPILHGDIGLKDRRLMPLAVMGDGLNRVAAIVLAIGSVPGGLVLIDDIDTGLHHSVMQSCWASIFKAAQIFDVQVVATTHSDEFAKAALGSAQELDGQDDFCLIRLERQTDKIASITYAPSELAVAVDADLEFR